MTRLFAVILLVALGAPAVANQTETWRHCRDWLRQARQIRACTALLASGRLSDAQRAMALRLRAKTYSRMGRHRLAIRDYTALLRLRPREADAYARRAHSRSELGQDAGAFEDASRAVKLDPKSFWGWGVRGELNMKAGRHAAAVRDFQGMIDANPRSWGGYFMMAHAYLKMKRYARARTYVRQAAARSPRNPSVWRLQIDLRVAAGDHRGAVDFVSGLIRIHPRAAWLYHRRGVIRETHLGDRAAAIADYRRAAALGHGPAQARLKALGVGPR